MEFREFLQKNVVYFDGGTGTLLQKAGLPLGELPERWNITHPETLQAVHQAYFDAGSNVVATNTFGANALKFSLDELDEIIKAAIENVKKAAEKSTSAQPKFVALDIGPSGKLLKPYGDFDFEDAVLLFAQVVKLGVKYGADLILIETMNDSYESKAALLAAKENSSLPVVVSNAYGEDGKLMTGASPAAMVALLEGMGADVIGVNCSFGPDKTAAVVQTLLEKSSTPVLVMPNAGLPKTENGETVYDVDEESFASYMAEFIKKGARCVGGCCGTTPAYIQKTVEKTSGILPSTIQPKGISCVSSYTHTVEFAKPVLIGERINPTGKKRFKQALLEGDSDYVLSEGIRQEENGAHILDVNVGLPEIDEEIELPAYVEKLQAVINLPLQIDTSNLVAMEKAMRRYNGKPLVNSVNGKKESMEAVFPLVKKYGGMVVALTLDENGIPATAEGRVAIAKKILQTAQSYGIDKKDVLIDTLAMSVSADSSAAIATLQALKIIKEELGVHTSLGVSNVSFGLPSRETVNAAFFTLALENGLSAAILNPNSVEMRKAYQAYLALKGMDENFENYIRFATEILPLSTPQTAVAAEQPQKGVEGSSPLQNAIIKGLKEGAAALCEKALQNTSPLDIVSKEIVPALDVVGKAYEEKRAYLPQLLISAEAAKSAFEAVRLHILKSGGERQKKCKVVLATVRGDIHDIGKNIVKTLLENYGFDVLDLGRDVAEEEIVAAVEKTRAPLVGLSALMTTTVPSMEHCVALLKERTPWAKVMVGGAVLTQEYAMKMGADAYAKDGMGAVRYAEDVYALLCKK